MKDDAELPFDSKRTNNRLSEVRVAEMFVEQYGDDFRYVSKWKMWMAWDGKRWREEGTLLVPNRIRAICTRQARGARSNTEVRGMMKNAFITGAENQARNDRQVAATIDQWDRDSFLLCTPAGIVDLRTDQTRESRREDHITKMTGVAPDRNVPTPTWDTHVRTVFAENGDLVGYFHRVLGYCLTGDVREDAVFFCWGMGGCGKTTTMEALLYIFGDYGREAPMEMFLQTSYGHGHPTDLTVLRGARLVVASEPDKGRRFSEARLKKLTGGGKISARGMRQDFYEFEMTHKLMFEGEHRPGLTTVDEGNRRRWNIIPFTGTITDIDKQISDKLKREAPGILAKMIDGCREWQQGGLRPPKIVTEATSDYLSRQDRTKEWFEECVVLDPTGDGAFTATLYASYRSFIAARGEVPVDAKTLVEELEARADEFGIKRMAGAFWIGKKNGRGFKGIKEVRMAAGEGAPF